MSEILLIDDDEAFRDSLAQALVIEGFRVREFSQPQSVLNRIGALDDVVVVSDIKMPKMTGEQLRQRLHERDSDIPIILITGHGDVSMAVNNLKAGAFGFFSKPVNLPEIIEDIRRASKVRQAVVEKRRLEVELVGRNKLYEMVQGSSKAIQEVRRQLARMAANDSNLMIVGETGAGKEVAARALHSISQRSLQPFVAVNCALIDEPGTGQTLFGSDEELGIMERAKDGTLFLDEIEALSPPVQTKLLRVLEERRFRKSGNPGGYIGVSCRILSSAKPRLKQSVSSGEFRDDLFYRLCMERVDIPPLRARRADCAMLFEHFVSEQAARANVAPRPMTTDILTWVMSQQWLGNVRELKAAALQFAGEQDLASTDTHTLNQSSMAQQVAEFEKALIASHLSSNNFDIRATAESLKTPRKTLTDKIAKYGLKPS